MEIDVTAADMEKETHLWSWLLFGSPIPPQRGKALLERWNRENHPLKDVLSRLPADAPALGLTTEEAAALTAVPPALPERPALRWNDALYPGRLQQLPLKFRPALLFYRGPAAVLSCPLVYLPPAPLNEEERERTREALGALLGEALLPAAFQGSDPAAVLLEEMADTEGQALLFARCGIDQLTLSATETELLSANRLLIVSPLPPSVGANPAWQSVLEQVASAMAARLLLTSPTQLPAAVPEIPGILLAPAPGPLPPHLRLAEDPAEVALWLTDLPAPVPTVPSAPATEPAVLTETPPLPPLAPDEALRTLSGSGAIPEVLRQRILKNRGGGGS